MGPKPNVGRRRKEPVNTQEKPRGGRGRKRDEKEEEQQAALAAAEAERIREQQEQEFYERKQAEIAQMIEKYDLKVKDKSKEVKRIEDVGLEDKGELLKKYLEVKGLIKQHLDSFNYFVNVEIQKIVKANELVTSEVDPNFYLKYTGIRVGKAERQEGGGSMGLKETVYTPQECRIRDMTYAGNVYVDIEYVRGRQIIRRKGVNIGRIPIMLRSTHCVLGDLARNESSKYRECEMDSGGYFVVRGVEKVILVQEQMSRNRIIVETDKKGQLMASVTSSTQERKSKTYMVTKNDRLYLKHNSLEEEIPIAIAFKAMGVSSDKEISQLVGGNEYDILEKFESSLEEVSELKIFTQEQSLEYIGSRIRASKFGNSNVRKRTQAEEGLELLSNVVVSHIRVERGNFRKKSVYIGMMARRVLHGMISHKLVDDKDFLGNKRLELAGQLLSLLFEDLFKRFNTDLRINIDKVLKKPNRAAEFDVYNTLVCHTDLITSGFSRAISSGNWVLKRFKMERAGVSHVLSRLSFIAGLGMMTRISSQFEKTRKVSGPRALQPSQWGMLCPSDTPEGELCGLVKNLALMTHITTDDEAEPIEKALFMLGVEDISLLSGTEIYDKGSYVVMLNGALVGVTRAVGRLLREFRKLRRRGYISYFVSISLDEDKRVVNVAADNGRIVRPLLIVENGELRVKKEDIGLLVAGKLTFDDFLRQGKVEYLDVNEENDSNIVLETSEIGPTTTHVEIEPFTILGAVAGLIPFPHHNQSPRNTYQSAMGKQAIGAIAYNQFERIDTLLYLMVYPQQPMVKTRTIELIGYDRLPAGQNAIVAVMSYSGYDIEDALVINKSSIDRGFGRCQVMRKYAALIKKYPNGSYDRIVAAPVDEEGNTPFKYSVVEPDGIGAVGEPLQPGCIVINKQVPSEITAIDMPSQPPSQLQFKPMPTTYRSPELSYLDKVVLTNTESDQVLVKCLLRQTRRPELGDKFSSRHGQKGVCGLIVEQQDFPFNDWGICPDVIMNPHGFPSRMTIGKMLELLYGKAGVLDGKLQYGTAFRKNDFAYLSSVLLENGFSYTGKDYLTSGITGDPIQAYIFFGPIYYQKLKHMVMDKMHARARGPRTVLTRQPTGGRSKDGGLRLGEMERDCLIGYGASMLLLERLLVSSDSFALSVCGDCGYVAYENWCQYCASSKNVTHLNIPYAAKLLFQELQAMNIMPKLVLENVVQT